MGKNYVKSFKCYILALLTAGSMGLAKTTPAIAEEIEVKTENPATETEETKYNLNKEYLLKDGNWKRIIFELFTENPAAYTMQKGDNLSTISRNVICKELGVPKKNDYWVVEAYMSGYPKVGQPGDTIYYIDSAEGMELALQILKTVNWYSRYVQKNGIYKDEPYRITISELIEDIFKIDDPELVIRYLAEKNMLCEYDGNSKVDLDVLVKLTEYIPTLDELGYKVPQK